MPPTWTAAELAERTRIEHFSGRVLVFRLQHPSVLGWSAVETRVALPSATTWVIALAARQAGRPALIRSPGLVLAYVWEGMVMRNVLLVVYQSDGLREPIQAHVPDQPGKAA